MNTMTNHFLTGFLVITALVVFSTQSAYSKDLVRIKGTINSAFQLVAENGEIYDVAITIRGEALINMVDSIVEVVGTIEEKDGMFVIKVLEFKVLKSYL